MSAHSLGWIGVARLGLVQTSLRSPTLGFCAVFALEALMFLWAARLVLGIAAPQTYSAKPHELNNATPFNTARHAASGGR
jgi:hypothetical protein